MSRKLTKHERALFRAIERYDLEAVRQLLSHSVDPNVADWSHYVGHYTALMHASSWQFPEAVGLLLKAGADPNASTVAGAGADGGTTALNDAITGNERTDAWKPNARLQIVEMLLKAGANPNAADAGDTPVLWNAASAGYADIVETLIAAGALPQGQPGCWPPLQGAAILGREEVARLLVDKGAPVDGQTPFGATPLMTAAKAGAEGVLKFLLEKGGNPNHRALNGDTPLISAATYARGAVTDRQHQVALRIVERLIEAGADPNARNNDGKTALSIVKDAESPLVANYLKEFAKPKAKQKK